jgi:hypothetical protein
LFVGYTYADVNSYLATAKAGFRLLQGTA